MALPTKALPTGSVMVDDVEVPIRGLSRSEALTLTTGFRDGTETGDVDGAEVFILVHGAGVDEAEAKRWRETTDVDTVGKLIDGILALSGLTEERNGKDPK